MKNIFFQFAIIIIIFSVVGCKQASSDVQAIELDEKVFVVNIVDDQKKLQEYLQYHKQVWQEVEGGFKKAGYKSITLYRFNNLIVMRVTFPKNADLNEMGKQAESFSPKCAEWNRLMANYQIGVKGTSPGQTWVEASQIYSFQN